MQKFQHNVIIYFKTILNQSLTYSQSSLGLCFTLHATQSASVMSKIRKSKPHSYLDNDVLLIVLKGFKYAVTSTENTEQCNDVMSLNVIRHDLGLSVY